MRAWEASNKQWIVQQDGRHFRITVQVKGVSLVDPPTSEYIHVTKYTFDLRRLAIIMMFAMGFFILSSVFVLVRACCLRRRLLQVENREVELKQDLPPIQKEDTHNKGIVSYPQPQVMYYGFNNRVENVHNMGYPQVVLYHPQYPGHPGYFAPQTSVQLAPQTSVQLAPRPQPMLTQGDK